MSTACSPSFAGTVPAVLRGPLDGALCGAFYQAAHSARSLGRKRVQVCGDQRQRLLFVDVGHAGGARRGEDVGRRPQRIAGVQGLGREQIEAGARDLRIFLADWLMSKRPLRMPFAWRQWSARGATLYRAVPRLVACGVLSTDRAPALADHAPAGGDTIKRVPVTRAARRTQRHSRGDAQLQSPRQTHQPVPRPVAERELGGSPTWPKASTADRSA